VKRVILTKDGLLSTPAASAIIREITPTYRKPFGCFILTASHNPAGVDGDVGIKFNGEDGGPSQSDLTSAIYNESKKLSSFFTCDQLPTFDLSEERIEVIESQDGLNRLHIEVISPFQHYFSLLSAIFDFSQISMLLDHPAFSFVFDGMNGVTGVYAHELFGEVLGVDFSSSSSSSSRLINCTPLPDFGGIHADPNLVYAKELCELMNIVTSQQQQDEEEEEEKEKGQVEFSMGCASDGDGDRNMILGNEFFVNPSDSLALILFLASSCIPYFRDFGLGGIKGFDF